MVARKYNNLNGEIWTKEDDILLAETVLNSVKDGNAVMDACRIVDEKTNGKRSASACKYRWHTRLKENYAEAYEHAKLEGKKKRNIRAKKINQDERMENIIEDVLNTDNEREIMIDDILVLVKKFKQQEEQKQESSTEDTENKLRREIERLKQENKRLREELLSMKAIRVEKKDKGKEFKINVDGTVEF